MIDFLQSAEWLNFQKSFGRKTIFIEDENVSANLIEHTLPLVGKYFYVPRGFVIKKFDYKLENILSEIKELAKKEKAHWLRLDVSNKLDLCSIINSHAKIFKAPHDVQPKEVFIIDIDKSEEDLFSEMKPKTRYNIKLAQKKGVTIREEKNLDEFLRLTKVMAKRQKVSSHPDGYYEKMFEVIPKDMMKLYVAEYGGKIIAADLVVFYDKVATYLHGASDDEYRNVMAPHLLKWQEILVAKNLGCKKFDFGGVKTKSDDNSWEGITRFKLGFSKDTKPTKYLGSYDIVFSRTKYFLYRLIQKIK